MNPGRELDAMVAEKVMGLTVYRDAGELWCGPPSDLKAQAIPHYSTSIAAAWQVVERLHSLAEFVTVLSTSDGATARVVSASGDVKAMADTAPHAICIAALRAVGVEL